MELCARGAALKVGIEEESQLRARAEQVQRWGGVYLERDPQCQCSYSRAAGARALPSVAATRRALVAEDWNSFPLFWHPLCRNICI